MKATDVFTPGTLPTHTYNDRAELNLEFALLNAIETKGFICSVSGPSKSGKTVLCESVIGKRGMLLITGGGITNEQLFWQRLRSKLGLPITHMSQKSSTTSAELKSEAGGSLQLPFVAKGEASVGGAIGGSSERLQSSVYDGPDGVGLLEFIRDKNYTLVVDDFHYIDRHVQKALAQQFKEAARSGCIIVVVSVSHRADDAIRVNPDLRGRVVSVDIPYWKQEELKTIAAKGFPLLNVAAHDSLIERITVESVASPQLMQALCLQVCRDRHVEETLVRPTSLHLGESEQVSLFQNATAIANCKTAFDVILAGARTRGSERKIHTLANGTSGDIYFVILKAIAAEEPLLALRYPVIKDRIERLVPTDPPRGVGITGTLEQMHTAVIEKLGEDRVLEWDKEKEVLNIPDPYFLYYLRWSKW